MTDFIDHHDGSLVDHERTYVFFVQLAYVGVMHIANFLVALAIGAVEGLWSAALLIMVVATGLSAWSFARGTKVPLAILLLVALVIPGIGGSATV